MKNNFLILLIAIILFSCNRKNAQQNDNTISKNMNNVFDNYYEERLKLFPLEATAIADNRYND
ncbi:MAG: DUF885 domain-containing protein, partial [Bacteroidia bacterium]|nr:DUF885 domain-containing protein [Bacteroidia bacterium]